MKKLRFQSRCFQLEDGTPDFSEKVFFFKKTCSKVK